MRWNRGLKGEEYLKHFKAGIFSNKGKYCSEETKQKIRQSQLGKKSSIETKEKLSRARKGNKFSLEHRKNLSKALKNHKNHLGHKHTEESKMKMSLVRKGRTFVDIYGKERAEEIIQKMRKNREINPNFGMEGKKHTLKSREKMRLSKINKPSTQIVNIDKNLLVDLYINKTMDIVPIAKKLNLTYTIIRNNLKRYNIDIRKKMSERRKQLYRLGRLGKKHSKEAKLKIRERRLKQIFPFKDTNIECMMKQELEKRNLIQYFQQHKPLFNIHQYDFVSERFKVIIECDGNYWHNYPDGRPKDRQHTKLAEDNGYSVLRFWEIDKGIGITENIECVGDYIQTYCK